MPRRPVHGGGQAAQAGAVGSLPSGGGRLSRLEHARSVDREYFRKNPRSRSYTRPYIEGECLALPDGAPRPLFVAVAFVSARMTSKALAFDRAELRQAKQEAEALAAMWRDGAAERGVSA
ncbi:hypothetical protein Dcar01_02554 [Deinococcus carri]|uniref:Uncharacterized protein n=1 Tax=Deinococcus carri TaxID=1211323 RepID=A0ABP9W9J4_9DEIO